MIRCPPELEDLPLFLCLGHGKEKGSDFCTPEQREMKRRSHKPPPCRFVCPPDTYVVLFADMGTTVYVETADKLADMFQDPGNSKKLHFLPNIVKGSLGFRTNFRMYGPGDQLPLLLFYPLGNFDTGGIHQSGVHRFPMATSYYPPAEEQEPPYNLARKRILQNVFQGSIFPTMKEALAARTDASGSTRTWSELSEHLSCTLEALLTTNKRGIYYIPICRVCMDQYTPRKSELLEALHAVTSEMGAGPDADTLENLSIERQDYEDLLNTKLRDKLWVTPASHPRLRPFTDTERAVHEHIVRQRRKSLAQQNKVSPVAAAASLGTLKRPIKIVDDSESDNDSDSDSDDTVEFVETKKPKPGGRRSQKFTIRKRNASENKNASRKRQFKRK